jgi:hypothetical protein
MITWGELEGSITTDEYKALQQKATEAGYSIEEEVEVQPEIIKSLARMYPNTTWND